MRTYASKIISSLKSPAIGKLWEFSRGERGRIALITFMNMVSAVISLAFTLVMRELVDSAVAGSRKGVWNNAILLATLIIVMLVSGYFRRMLYTRTRVRLLRNIRSSAIHSLLQKKFASLRAYHSGELVNHIFSDVSVMADGIVNIVPPLLYLIIQLIGASIILYRMNSGFMLILLFTGAFGSLASFAFRHKMKAFHKESQEAEDKFHARVQETLQNLRIIKASGTESRMERETDVFQENYSRTQIRRSRFSAFMGVGLGFIFRASWFYALLWGCTGIYRGSLTYGTLTAILQLVNQIQSPFEGLISTLSSAYGTISSTERMMALYALPDETPSPKVDGSLSDFREIRLDDVKFDYNPEEDVLNGVNLTIKKGDTMAIMGPSGCGKSTLFSLLLGIYDPNGGEIRVSVGKTTVNRTLRALFAYVPQGNALFSGTLRENIAMFLEEMPKDEKIMEAARMACIDDFIRAQSSGLDTRIGEHGLGLSEGQAQRIAIARALMTDAPILLLDESTSALDEQTEARLLKNIADMRDRTCLIVTHRRAALEICNRRIDLRDGRVAQDETAEC